MNSDRLTGHVGRTTRERAARASAVLGRGGRASGAAVAGALARLCSVERSTWAAVAGALPLGLVLGALGAAVPMIPLVLVAVGSTGPTPPTGGATTLGLAAALALGRAVLVLTPALLVLAVAVRAAAPGTPAASAHAGSRTRTPGPVGQLLSAARRLPSLLGTLALAAVAVAALVVFALPMSVALALVTLLALARGDQERAGRWAVRAVPFAAAGAAALALLLALPASATGSSPLRALTRSRRCTRGRRWRTAGALLAAAALGVVPDLLLAVPVLTGAVGASSPGALQALAALLAWAGSCLVLVVVGATAGALLARTTQPSEPPAGAVVRGPARGVARAGRLRPALPHATRVVGGALVVALLAAVLPVHAGAARAADVTVLSVNTTNDPQEWAGDDCTDHVDGLRDNCSLRQALARAALTDGPDELVLGPDLGAGAVTLDVNRPLPLVGGVVLDGESRTTLRPGPFSDDGPLLGPGEGTGPTELRRMTLHGGGGNEGAGGALTVSAGQTVRLLEVVLRGSTGGAVVNGGTLTLERSTVLDSAAPVVTSSGALTVLNSTLVTAADEPGATVRTVGGGTTTLTAVTLLGGGTVDAPEGTVKIRDSLLASPRGCSGTVTGGPNLSNGAGCAAAGPVAGLATAAADNGGPTPTVLLAPDSPALGAADAATCPAVDQRGVVRPADACDLGAVQVGPVAGGGPAPTLGLTAPTPDSVLGDPVALTATLAGAAGPARLVVVDTLPVPEVEVAHADLPDGATTLDISLTGLSLGAHRLVARTTVAGVAVASAPLDHRVQRPPGPLTLLVDDAGDDPAVGPDTCTTGTPCTLRGALVAAAALPAPRSVSIGVAAGRDLTVLTRAPLPLVDGVTVDGDGRLTVDAQGDHPVTRASGDPVTTTLLGLTLAHGAATDPASLETLAGGALHVRPGDVVTLRDSVLRGNASPYGGAVFNAGTLVVDRSALVDDRGVDPRGLPGFDSTWRARFGATGAVSGILSRGRLTVTDSTLHDEYGDLYAPAVLQESLPVATLDQVTADLSGPLAGAGADGTPALLLRNSLLLHPLGTGRCWGLTPDSGPNGVAELPDTRVDPAQVAAACAAGPDPVTGLDLGFGDHGGPTPTYALSEDSNARGAGDAATCLPTDQRGLVRPAGACDLGAFQFAASTQSLRITVNPLSFVGDHVPVVVDLGGAPPAGSLEVLDGDTIVGSTPVVAGAAPVVDVTGLSAGDHVLHAVYRVGGVELTSPPTDHRVQWRTTTTLVSAGPVAFGTDAHLTVTVTAPPGAPAPTGQVLIRPGDARVDLVDGVATVQLPTEGQDLVVTARYLGDELHTDSDASVTQSVTALATTTTASGSLTIDRLGGLPVDATVTSDPPLPVGGRLEVREGDEVLGTLDVVPGPFDDPQDGVVHGTLPVDLPAGRHGLTLAFVGAPGLAPSSATVTVTVTRVTSTVALEVPSQATYAAPPTVRVSLAPAGRTGRGTATLLDGTTPVATVDLVPGADGLTGKAPLPRLALGVHRLTASFDGDADLTPATSGVAELTVVREPVTMRLELPAASGIRGHDIVIRAVLTPDTAGTVVVQDATGGARAEAPVVDGVAELSLPATTLGRHDLTAELQPADPGFSTATATASYEVVLRSTSLQVDPGPREVPFGLFAADVTLPGTDGVVPTGTVRLEWGDHRSAAVTLVDGRAHVPFPDLPPYPQPGAYGYDAWFPYAAVSVVYSGDADYAPATASTAVRVLAEATSTVLTELRPLEPVPGTTGSTFEDGPVRFSATVARADGRPAGYGLVAFRSVEHPLELHLACVGPDGTATVDDGVHGEGLHTYTATFMPAGCGGPSVGGLLPSTSVDTLGLDVRPRPPAPALQLSLLTELGGAGDPRPAPQPAAAGDLLLVRVGDPSRPGTLAGLTLQVDGTPVGRRADGLFVLPTLHAGAHVLRAAFPGDARLAATQVEQPLVLTALPVHVEATMLEPASNAPLSLDSRLRVVLGPVLGHGGGALAPPETPGGGYGRLRVLVDGQVEEERLVTDPTREALLVDRPAPAPLAAGPHRLEVEFTGSHDVSSVSSVDVVTVQRSPSGLTLDAPATAPVAGRPLTVQVRMRREPGLPSASVLVSAGDRSCTAVVTGVGSCTLDGTGLVPGRLTLRAEFDGNDFLAPASVATALEVLPATASVDVRRRAGAYVLAGRPEPLADVAVSGVPAAQTRVVLVDGDREQVLCRSDALASGCAAAAAGDARRLVLEGSLRVRVVSPYAAPVEVDAGPLSVARCTRLPLGPDALPARAGDCPDGAAQEYLPSQVSGQDVRLDARPRPDTRVRSWSLPGGRSAPATLAGGLDLVVDDLLDDGGLVQPVYKHWVDCVPLLVQVGSAGSADAGAVVRADDDEQCARQQLEEPQQVDAPPGTQVSWHVRGVPAQVRITRGVFGTATAYRAGDDALLPLLFATRWSDHPVDVHDYDPATQVRVYDMSGPLTATVTVNAPCVGPELFVGQSRAGDADGHGRLAVAHWRDPVDGVVVGGTVLERAAEDAAAWGNPRGCLPGTSLQYQASTRGPENGVHSLRVGLASDPRLHTGTPAGDAADLQVRPWLAVGTADPAVREVTTLADPTVGVEAVFSRVYCHQVTLSGAGPLGMPGSGTAADLVLEPAGTCPAAGPGWFVDGSGVRAIAAAKAPFASGLGHFDAGHLDELARRAGAGEAAAATELRRLEDAEARRDPVRLLFAGFREQGEEGLLGRTVGAARAAVLGIPAPETVRGSVAELDLADPVHEDYAERAAGPLPPDHGSLEVLRVTRPLALQAVYAASSTVEGLGCGALTVTTHPAGVPVQRLGGTDACGVTERVPTGEGVTLRAGADAVAGLVPVWELRDATVAGVRTGALASQPGHLGYEAHYQVETAEDARAQQGSEVRFAMPPYAASADLWLCQQVRPRVLVTDDTGHELALGDQESAALVSVRSSDAAGRCPVAGAFLPGTPVTIALRPTVAMGYAMPAWEVGGTRTSGTEVTTTAGATGELDVGVHLQVECRTLTVDADGPVTTTPAAANCPGARPTAAGVTRWVAGTVVALTAGEKEHNDFWTWHGDVVRQDGATAITVLDRDRFLQPDWNRRSDAQIIVDGLSNVARSTVGVLSLIVKSVVDAEAQVLTLARYAVMGITTLLDQLGVSGQGLDVLHAIGASLDLMATGLNSTFDCLYETSYQPSSDVTGMLISNAAGRVGTAGGALVAGGVVVAMALDPPAWQNTATEVWDGYGSQLGDCIARKNLDAWGAMTDAWDAV